MSEVQTVEKVEIAGENIRVTVLIPKEQVLGDRWLGYDDKRFMQKEIVQLITQEVLKDKLKEITEEVLTGVNWAELVRSEVAQQVIKDIVSGRNKQSY